MALTDENMSTTMLVQPSGGVNYGNMGGGIFGNDGLTYQGCYVSDGRVDICSVSDTAPIV